MPLSTTSLYRSLVSWSCALTCLSIGLASLPATADVIADRKANFKANGAAMKTIAAAIGDGNRDLITAEAKKIAAWAAQIPAYFPEGSDSGDTKARAEIWFDFADFTNRAKANEDAANALVKAATTGDPAAMIAGLKNLGASCKACHSTYKD